MKYRMRSTVIDAITFDELVAHGIASGGNIVNSMPWSFEYAGFPISHENDDCYLIPTPNGTMKMGRDDMLVTISAGRIQPIQGHFFMVIYEPA